MDLIADALLIIGALGAALYCIVLSRRLRRFTDLEKGVGGAIAVLSLQVDGMTKTLKKAQTSAIESANSLNDLTSRAEKAARRLELLVASMHDLPDEARNEPPAPSPPEPTLESEQAPSKPEQTEPDSEQTAPSFLSKRAQYQEAAE